MTYEVLDGTTNVVRFPIEERARPSIELMRDIRPDVRVLLANAETFGFEAPSPVLRSLADRETACHIETSMSQGELPSAEFVADLVEPLVSSGRQRRHGMPSRRAVTPKRRSFWRVRRWSVATPMPSGCSSVRMRRHNGWWRWG